MNLAPFIINDIVKIKPYYAAYLRNKIYLHFFQNNSPFAIDGFQFFCCLNLIR